MPSTGKGKPLRANRYNPRLMLRVMHAELVVYRFALRGLWDGAYRVPWGTMTARPDTFPSMRRR